MGKRVAAIHESVNEDAVDTLLLGHFEQGVKMSLIGMHAAIGAEAEEMHPPAAGAGVFHGRDKNGMREKFAILDHQLDARAVHVHDAPGTNVEMADFAIAHLAIGQADIFAAGVNQSVGIFAQQSIIGWLARQSDRVGVSFGAISPAVEDDEYQGFGTSHTLLAFGSWLLALALSFRAE